jgi:hypothetical protein
VNVPFQVTTAIYQIGDRFANIGEGLRRPENGYQKVDTFSGSGYLLPSRKSMPTAKYMVGYEIVILLNPAEKRACALGYMVGDPAAFEQATKTDEAQLNYSPEKMWDIQIKSLEANTANFTVLSPIGI